jgi:hypothetical protein
MSKESIALINGHEYKYRYNPETKLMDYLGPVGEAPSLTQEQFRSAMEERKEKIHPPFYRATREETDKWRREEGWEEWDALRRSGKLSSGFPWNKEPGKEEWEWVKANAFRILLVNFDRYRGSKVQDAYRRSRTTATKHVLQQPSRPNMVYMGDGRYEPDFDWNWAQVEIVNGAHSYDDYKGHVYWWEEKGAYVFPRSTYNEDYDLVYVEGRYPGRE